MKFKLQTVLDYRLRLEDQARQRLAEAQQVQQRCRQRRDAAQRERERLDTALRLKQRQGIDPDELRLYQDRIDLQQRLLETAQVELAAADGRVEQRQSELLQARQDREAMEKLKGHHEERQRLEDRRREIRQLDEVGARERTKP